MTGRLVTTGHLHVGSGFEETVSSGKDDDSTSYRTLCLDAAGDPYIPASTLRGLICSLLDKDCEEHLRLCGSARRAIDEGIPVDERVSGNAGAMRLYDARWVQEQRFNQRLESRVSLDPVTRTAANHLLFTDALIPAGAEFYCRFELDRIDEQDLDAFLAAVRRFGETTGIGAGRSRMQGGISWPDEHEAVQVLTRPHFVTWLLDDDRPLAFYFEKKPEYRPSGDGISDGHDSESGSLTIEMLMQPESPLLVSPVRGVSGDGSPDLVFQQENGRVRLAASSLKGMLRAQCRRILLTRLEAHGENVEYAPRVADDMVGYIFGCTASQALLRIGDAAGPFTSDEEHRQFFNAVDRFTGGVAEHRLYNVTAVMPKELSWKLEFSQELLDSLWPLGLLVYVLRDAMEGDLNVGWGRARGFGAFRLALKLPEGTVISEWPELLQQLAHGKLGITEDDAGGWLEKLEDELVEGMGSVDS